MPEFGVLGKMLIVMGLGIVAIGVILSLIGKLPNEGSGLGWLGKLPGDFLVKRDNFTLYFPLSTSIIISIVGSLVLYLFMRR